MAFEIAENALGGGGHGGGHHGGGHHGGGHGGGGGGHHGHHGHHGGGYWGGGWDWGYPWYYDSYPTVYAEPIYITQEIKPDCGSNPCLSSNPECQAKCKAAKPVAGLGGIAETMASIPPWVLTIGAAVLTLGALKHFWR